MTLYLDYIPEGAEHKNPIKDRRVDYIPAEDKKDKSVDSEEKKDEEVHTRRGRGK